MSADVLFSHPRIGHLLLTLAWQSTLWLALGLTASRLLRRHAARAHLVLVLTALAAILSPLSTIAVRHMDWGLLPARPSAADISATSLPAATLPLVEQFPLSGARKALPLPESTSQAHVSNISASQKYAASESASSANGIGSTTRFDKYVPAALCVCWFIASVVLTARVAVSLRSGHHIARAARVETSPALLTSLREAAGALGLRSAPDLRVSAQAQCPMIWCWGRRPVLLVPESAAQSGGVNWRSVFCHELAHLVRRDHWSALWAEVLVIALPWQPLAWRSRRRLAFLREQACDDWVLAAGSRATDYAESLLSFLPQRTPAIGLSVLGEQESLKHRLERLLAAVRVNPRVGTTQIAVSAFSALAAVVGVALAQPGSANDEATAPSSANVRATRPTERSAKTASRRFSGRVVQPDGKAAAGARVFLTRSGDKEVQFKTETGSDGKFDFSVNSDVLFGTRWLQVVAVKPGFGLAWIEVEELKKIASLTLKLVADDLPIDGRIANLEGRPVVGATIQVVSIATFPNEDPKPYIELLKTDERRASNFRFHSSLGEIPQAPSARTDDQGHFRLTGIGRHRRANLTVVGRSIADTRLQVLTDPFEATFNISTKRESAHAAHAAYGARFTHFVRPSRLVVGIVTDAKSGRPVEGVRVSQLDGCSPATTDALGRFKLDGCAKADKCKLFAIPPDQSSYFSGSLTARDQPGLSPLEVQLHVYPAIPLSGRVIETNSGRPVPAEIQYYPLYPNAYVMKGMHGSEIHSLGPSGRSFSKPDGSFAIGIAPGPGALLVRVVGKENYEPPGVDAEAFFKQRGVTYQPDSRADGSRDFLTVALGKDLHISAPQHQYQGIALLNVPETAKQVAQDVSVRSKVTSTGK